MRFQFPLSVALALFSLGITSPAFCDSHDKKDESKDEASEKSNKSQYTLKLDKHSKHKLNLSNKTIKGQIYHNQYPYQRFELKTNNKKQLIFNNEAPATTSISIYYVEGQKEQKSHCNGYAIPGQKEIKISCE